MIEFFPRRNWQHVKIRQQGTLFSIYLDEQTLKTTGGAELRLPTKALAELIASEWNETEFQGKIDLADMPMTRRAFGVIGYLNDHRIEAIDQILNYAAHELLCHRAPKSSPLSIRQDAEWEPILNWAERKLHAPLIQFEGIMPQPQPLTSLANLRQCVDCLSVFSLAAFIDMVTLSGSFLLALAVLHGRLKPIGAWRLSRLEEEWQIEHWGRDAEANQTTQIRLDEFKNACAFEAAARKRKRTEYQKFGNQFL